jgi:hypothetical protein
VVREMEVKSRYRNYFETVPREQSTVSDLKIYFSVLDELAEKIDEYHRMRDENWMKFADNMADSGLISDYCRMDKED